jgi:hypothetical protein
VKGTVNTNYSKQTSAYMLTALCGFSAGHPPTEYTNMMSSIGYTNNVSTQNGTIVGLGLSGAAIFYPLDLLGRDAVVYEGPAFD